MTQVLQTSEEPPDLSQRELFLSRKNENSITTVDGLEAALSEKGIYLSSEERADIEAVTEIYPMRINQHYFSLIKEKGDSIWRQSVPSIEEIIDTRGEEDPLREENGIPYLTHRYPDRALLLVSNTCAMYCRFCTRKRKVGEEQKNPRMINILNAINHISNYNESHEEPIRDLILSGGDPLLLSNNALENILQEVRKIPKLEMVRIGTRVPCVMPSRITDSLVSVLSKYSSDPPLYINTHFEHPSEVTQESKVACEKLARAGIPLGNQSVILKGVNDSPETFRELNRKLLSIKVRPYYVYQPDPVKGTYHFIGPVENGLKIIQDGLRGHTSGLAVPHFVIDAPGGGGKIPILPEYSHLNPDSSVSLTNYQGRNFIYPSCKI